MGSGGGMAIGNQFSDWGRQMGGDLAGAKEFHSGTGRRAGLTTTERQLKGMGKELWEGTDPYRQGLMDILSGEGSVEDMPLYQRRVDLARRGTQDAFGQAMDQILANVPAGATGMRQRAMQDASLAQAEQQATLGEMIAQQMADRAMGLGEKAIPAAMSAYQQAAALQAQRRGQLLARNAQILSTWMSNLQNSGNAQGSGQQGWMDMWGFNQGQGQSNPSGTSTMAGMNSRQSPFGR